MSGAATILWTAVVDEVFAVAQKAAREADTAILEMTIEALPENVAIGLDRGAVIAVTACGAEATHAFGLGVDEVLTVGQITPRVLETTIRAARARAESRLGQPAHSQVALADVTQGLALLTAALDQQLSPPLLAASDACLALRQEFDHLVLTTDRLQQWAALIAPTGEMEAVARQRAQCVRSSVHRKLHDVRNSLVRAETLISLLRDVSAVEARRGCVDVSSVVGQLRDLVLPHVGAWATLHIYSDGECVAQMPRPVFVCIVSALIARAVTAIRGSRSVAGEIEIRISEKSEQEATVLVEIFDNGEPELSFGPEVGRGSQRSLPSSTDDGLLSSIREHARQFGGELLVQGDAAGTTVRLFVPTPGAGLEEPWADEAPARFVDRTHSRR
jgi:signal transduction histidine kinase